MRAARFRLVAGALFGALLAATSAAGEIRVDGRVLKPGAQPLTQGMRLLNAVQAAGVRSDAYLAGAAWLSTKARNEQRDLKLGLLHDLTQLLGSARIEGRPARESLARELRERVERLPVTGRVPVSLDPVRLELEAKHNRRLQAGDVISYPERPSTVRVVGAVVAECALPFAGLQGAADYAAACPRHAAADPDWLYAIQPDGAIRRFGIAPWNAEPAPTLAPGATVLVPVEPDAESGLDFAQLNGDLARLLATQPLPAEARP